MIKLRDLLSVPRLRLALRACETGRDSWIRWAGVIEDLEDAVRLTGGELVVTSGRWRRSPADAERFACALVQRGAGALALDPAGPAPDGTLHELIAACEHWRLPLVELPPGTSGHEVVEAAITLIVDRRGAGLLRGAQRERSFAAALGAPAPLPQILALLRRETGRPVWLLTRGATFAAAGEDPSDGDARASAETLADTRGIAELTLSDARPAVAFPLPASAERGSPPAWIVCETAPDALSSEDRIAVEQAILFAGVHFASERSRRLERRVLAREFVRRAVSGDASGEELDAWARALGVEPRGHVVCVVAHVPRATPEDIADIAGSLDDVAASCGVRGVTVTGDQEAATFLFAGDLDERIGRGIARSRAILEPELRRLSGALGTSSVMAREIADVMRTLHDARRVCQVNLLSEPEPVPDERPPEPPLSTLLLLGNDEARAALHSTVLEPLVAYDEAHGSELVRTLDVFLSTTGQWSASAAELGIHVNTLRYRLARIEKCTGRDLGSMTDRVDFYVALRARQALTAPTRLAGSATPPS